MTSFEKHLGRPMCPDEGIREREYYVSKILTKEQLQKRVVEKQKEPVQLKLFS